MSESNHTPFSEENKTRALTRAWEKERDENTSPEDFEYGEFLIVRTAHNQTWAGRYHGESPKGLFLFAARRLMPELSVTMRISTVAVEGVAVALPPAVSLVRVRDVVEVIYPSLAAIASIEAAEVYNWRKDKPEVPMHGDGKVFNPYDPSFTLGT
jgi:hypothetical protein